MRGGSRKVGSTTRNSRDQLKILDLRIVYGGTKDQEEQGILFCASLGIGTLKSSSLVAVLAATIPFIYQDSYFLTTYDHRPRRSGHPIYSALHKPQIGILVADIIFITIPLILSFLVRSSLRSMWGFCSYT